MFMIHIWSPPVVVDEETGTVEEIKECDDFSGRRRKFRRMRFRKIRNQMRKMRFSKKSTTAVKRNLRRNH